MEQLTVEECYNFHKSVFEHWTYGEPVENWTDDSGYLCIRYACGVWFHYRRHNNVIEFW